jgi:hypothetical protein
MRKTLKSFLIVLVSSFFAIQMNAQVYYDRTAGGSTVIGNKNLGVNTDDPEAQIHLNSDCGSTYKNPIRITKAYLSNSIFCQEGKLFLKWLDPGLGGLFGGGLSRENLMPLNNIGEASMITESVLDCNNLYHWDIDVRGYDNTFVIRNISENISTTPSVFSNAKDVIEITPSQAYINVPTNIPILTTDAITTSSINLNGDISIKGNLKIKDANGNIMWNFRPDGRLGVGVTDAEMVGPYYLWVKNGIMAERLKVAVKNTMDWSDFVFSKNYKLKPLNEVENYISKNNHLPDIPSAEEVVTNGIDVQKMDAKLLQKIEELTLYVIELKKEIDLLKKYKLK